MPHFILRIGSPRVLLFVLFLAGGAEACKPIYFVSIENPGATLFTSAQTVTLTAAGISGEEYVIEEMRFYHNGEVVGVDLDGAPYTHNWVIGARDNGSHAWRVEAFYLVRGSARRMLPSDTVVYDVEIDGSRSVGRPGAFPPPGNASVLATVLNGMPGVSRVCSEPMNWNGGSGLGGLYDPSDTEGEGSLECHGGLSVNFDGDATNGSFPDIDVPGLRPLGADPSWNHLYAVEIDPDAGDNNGLDVHGLRVETTDGTFCGWAYHAHDPSVVFDDTSERMKVAEVNSSSQQLQLEWDHGLSGKLRPQMHGGGSGTGSVVDMNDCVTDLCQIEFCLDYNGAEIDWRVRIHSISTGESETIRRDYGAPVSYAGTWTTDDPFLTHLHVQHCAPYGCDEGPGDIVGKRYVAFAGQALVEPHDPTFWPGPEAEVEGCEALEHGSCP